MYILYDKKNHSDHTAHIQMPPISAQETATMSLRFNNFTDGETVHQVRDERTPSLRAHRLKDALLTSTSNSAV